VNYQARLEKVWGWMAREGIALAMFEDFEPRRDSTIRWLTGQPGDALLFLAADSRGGGKSLLVPWDVILAKSLAKADAIVPYNDFDRAPLSAIQGAAKMLGVPAGSKIEIPPATPYPAFVGYAEGLSGFEVVCRDDGAAALALDLRTAKDDGEIAVLRQAAGVTNEIIALLEDSVRDGRIKTEADAALLIEVEARRRGCEGASFETLAAGPERSFGIHAFPAWTDAPFAARGLSILDFGVRFRGYCTDVTLTFARDPSPRQQEMIGLVEKAAEAAKGALAPGSCTQDIAALVQDLFAKSNESMVHGLGHGVGLDVHEYPFVRNRYKTSWNLRPGMVLSIEPGLYDPEQGGCRLENVFLITAGSSEALTKSRIIRL